MMPHSGDKIIESLLRAVIREALQEEEEEEMQSYFTPGDTILYGKWKNKAAIVLSITRHRDTGEPLMICRPIKGGSDVTMSLFKMRRR
jgi:hypothetical protein